MSTIPDHPTSPLPGQGSPIENKAIESRSRQVSAHESLRAGLTIQTREGDVVTLFSDSMSQFDASSYTRQGILETGQGGVSAGLHLMETTLTSGKAFSFSVRGNLNQQELADIESIVKGVDQIISEMSQGDMDGAVEQALSMGGYDSVSMYTADIRLTRSVSVTEKADFGQALSRGDGPSDPLAPERGPVSSGQSLMEKMARLLESQEEKLLEKSRQPISSLFMTYLKELEEQDKKETKGYDFLETARQETDRIIGSLIRDAFSSGLDTLL